MLITGKWREVLKRSSKKAKLEKYSYIRASAHTSDFKFVNSKFKAACKDLKYF